MVFKFLFLFMTLASLGNPLYKFNRNVFKDDGKDVDVDDSGPPWFQSMRRTFSGKEVEQLWVVLDYLCRNYST